MDILRENSRVWDTNTRNLLAIGAERCGSAGVVDVVGTAAILDECGSGVEAGS